MFFIKLTHSPLFCVGISAIVAVTAALANQPQEESIFNISPMVNILSLRGGKAKGVINVANNGKGPLRMRIYSENFTYERSKGFVTTDNHPQSAVNYLQFAPRELIVPPGITRNVRVGTTIPANLPDGEYRAAIFVEDLNEKDITNSQGQQIKLQARVACVFYFSKGATKSDLSMAAAIWHPASKDLMMVLGNKGKKTSYPAVNWRLEKEGKVVAEEKISGILLQSQTEREIALQLTAVRPTAGNYALVGEIKEANQKPIPFNIKVVIP
jgi:hypothetical protein